MLGETLYLAAASRALFNAVSLQNSGHKLAIPQYGSYDVLIIWQASGYSIGFMERSFRAPDVYFNTLTLPIRQPSYLKISHV
jgi:hypothetical protein